MDLLHNWLIISILLLCYGVGDAHYVDVSQYTGTMDMQLEFDAISKIFDQVTDGLSKPTSKHKIRKLISDSVISLTKELDSFRFKFVNVKSFIFNLRLIDQLQLEIDKENGTSKYDYGIQPVAYLLNDFETIFLESMCMCHRLSNWEKISENGLELSSAELRKSGVLGVLILKFKELTDCVIFIIEKLNNMGEFKFNQMQPIDQYMDSMRQNLNNLISA